LKKAADLVKETTADSAEQALKMAAELAKSMSLGNAELSALEGLGNTVGNSAGNLSLEFGLGFASGYAAKKGMKGVCLAIGGTFAVLQGLAHSGYIEIDHTKLRGDLEKALGARDAAVTSAAVRALWDRFQGVMTTGLPPGTGFVPGLWVGFTKG